eukprot:s1139_g25.t1
MVSQSPIVAWGNVSCFSETQPFDACCLAGLQLYDTTNRLCMSGCQPRSCFRQRSYASCCQVARPLRLYGRRKAANQCFSGCGEPSWAEFLRVFRLSHGCVHCIGRHDLTDKSRGCRPEAELGSGAKHRSLPCWTNRCCLRGSSGRCRVSGINNPSGSPFWRGSIANNRHDGLRSHLVGMVATSRCHRPTDAVCRCADGADPVSPIEHKSPGIPR